MNYGQIPVPAAAPAQSWFSRNWKWVVPLAVGAPLLFVGGILSLVFGIMRSSEPYKYSTKLVMHDPQALQALGLPVKIGWLVTGSVNIDGSSGYADLAIPVKGGLHPGKLYVIAKKSMDVWHYESIQLGIEGQSSKLDLLHHIMVQPEER
jgi:hypothetical protein